METLGEMFERSAGKNLADCAGVDVPDDPEAMCETDAVHDPPGMRSTR